jgi:hypothetical protein
MAVAEFSGVDTVSPLDKTVGTVGTGNIPSSGNMTPSLSGELFIGSGTHNGNTVTTAGPGFTMIAVPTEDSNTHQPLAMEYQVLNGTPQTAATFNLATGYPWTQNGVLFKPTVTAATLVSIAVTPSSPSIALGTTQQLTATGTYSDGSTQNLTTTVTWGSLDTTIANISNANGSQGLASPIRRPLRSLSPKPSSTCTNSAYYNSQAENRAAARYSEGQTIPGKQAPYCGGKA